MGKAPIMSICTHKLSGGVNAVSLSSLQLTIVLVSDEMRQSQSSEINGIVEELMKMFD